MDGARFNAWTRRRFGLAAGSTVATLLSRLGLDDTDARNRHHHKHKNKRKRKRKQKRRQQRRDNAQAAPPTNPAPIVNTTSPDIILINVDDMRESDYLALPQTRVLLGDLGTTFPNYFATTPLCGPSRASLLRGQYVHNHGVLRNGGEQGGWATFHDRGDDESTIATWLRETQPAYRTALVGKYLNGYHFDQDHIGPGWSDWFVPVPVGFYN